MAELLLQKVSKAGTAITYVAAATDGDFFKAVPGAIVHFKNAHATLTRSIGIAAVTSSLATEEAGLITLPGLVIVVPALGERMFTVPPAYYSGGGVVTMIYTLNQDLTVAVLYAG